MPTVAKSTVSWNYNAIPFAQYQRALVYVVPYWRGFLLVVILGLFSTAVGLVNPYISRLLIDDALLRRNMHSLVEIAVLMVVVTVLGFLLNIVSSYYYTKLSAESLFDMRLAVYRHLQRLSPRYFTTAKLGDIVSRINNDIGEVQRVCSDTLLSVLSNFLFFAGSILIMSWLNWRLFLVSIVLLPISIVALRHYQGRLTLQTRVLRERSSDLGSFLIESFLGMRLVVASGNENYEAEKFRRHNAGFVQSLLSLKILSFLAGALPGTVLTLSTAIVFLYGGKLVINGSLTIGALVAFMAYHLRLLAPVQSLLGTYTSLLTGGVALGRVLQLFDVPIEVHESPDAQPLNDLRADIVFDRVRFKYSQKVPVIDEVSLSIPAGALCVIVGSSGAGKSTLADLLLRLYDPDSGVITIGGHDLRNLRFEDLRREIAVVEQTPFFFHASIQENISYGRPQATLSDIRPCARAAAIDDFIQSLPEGYATIIGERGSTISAGERQRIALARALLRDPSILIMDEPTAALDPASEAAISRAFGDVLRGRTAILITHRKSLVEIADLVVVIESGRVVESGSPDELLAKTSFLSRHFQLGCMEAQGTV
ncbi:MAG: ABC transporter ATP-binding protein [Candidatus Sulfotelmatobacter sp.]